MQYTRPNAIMKSCDDDGFLVPHRPLTENTALRAETRNEQFLNMRDSFRLTGGLAHGHEMASLLSMKSGRSISALARWMVEREVVYFDWQHNSWFPMFQFIGPNLSVRVGIGQILKEFNGVLDPWETAQWFACPSPCLSCRAPADEMAFNPASVLEAARCTRYAVDA